ncbi:hypothetical protein [Geothermobacter ehrlichii]|uniref:hypothetical protein n=1 Tax=Geothermobacter ehrlichii TaxID=213224 RepID=UPI001FE5F00F|nr:hypothetical protein [Geothermobacter ehrlichii]
MSPEQTEGVAQVSQGLTQIDQATQPNTTSAEKSAAAAEELSNQVEELLLLPGLFTLRTGDNSTRRDIAHRTSCQTLVHDGQIFNPQKEYPDEIQCPNRSLRQAARSDRYNHLGDTQPDRHFSGGSQQAEK